MNLSKHSRRIRKQRDKEDKTFAKISSKPKPKRWANLRKDTHAKNTVIFKNNKTLKDGWWIDLPYLEYLKTPYWKDTKYKFVHEYCNGYISCHECKRKPTKKELETGRWKRRFHIHHKTYKNIGHEKMEDLEMLCWRCHKRKHENARTRKSEMS